MRSLTVMKAYVNANLLVLADLVTSALVGDEHVRPPLVVYSKYSMEPFLGRMIRQVGVGYWTEGPMPGPGPQWTDYKIFFQELYDEESDKWIRQTTMRLQKAA